MKNNTPATDFDLAAEREWLRDIFEKMLKEKREYQRTAAKRFENDPILKKAFEKLEKENGERGIPITRIQL